MKRRVRLQIPGMKIAVVRRQGESESELPTAEVRDRLQDAADAALREDYDEASE